MKEISLSRGKVALVDDEDYEWLMQWKWYAKPGRYTFYAARKIRVAGRQRIITMHRQILGLEWYDGRIGDHKNQNGLDCRKENLRIATKSHNQYNCKAYKNNSSNYRGVTWHKRDHKWIVHIGRNGKLYIGIYQDKIEAAIAYDRAAIKYYGKDAKLNFPDLTTPIA